MDDGTLGLLGLGLTLAAQGSSHPALAGWRLSLWVLGCPGEGQDCCLELRARREEAGKEKRHRGVGFKHASSVFGRRLLYAGIKCVSVC